MTQTLNKNEYPKISIVTPSFNSAKYIEDCIQSVLNQNYPNFEHIIIDGGSKDETIEILKKYTHLKWVSEPDEGIYDAMNKGIYLSTGEIIGILNSDDFYEKEIFKTIAEVFTNNKNIAVLHGDMRVWYNTTDHEINRFKKYQKFYCMWIKHPTCFIRKSIYNKYGVFNIKYKYQADYELIVRFKKYKLNFYYLPKVITNFRIGGASTKNWSFFESYYIRRKNGFPIIWAFLSALMVRGIFKLKILLRFKVNR